MSSRATGSISLVIGPMFAGKTTELMRRYKRQIFAQNTCCIIKYSKDVRYTAGVEIASHDNQQLEAKFAVCKLSELGEQWRQFDVIAIDEGQFFPDLLTFTTVAANEGKTVIVSALDGDFQQKPFGQICELIPHCESVTKLTAICMHCHSAEASFTKRTVSSTQQELIGSDDIYAAVCRKCNNDPSPPTPGKRLKYNVAKSVVQGKRAPLPDAAAALSFLPSEKKHRTESAERTASPDAASATPTR